jgi:hypothetical protein
MTDQEQNFADYPHVVIGVDPGPHTGIAVIEGRMLTLTGTFASTDGALPYVSVARFLEYGLNVAYLREVPCYVVIERFNTIQPGIGNTKAALDTVKMIGMLDYWVEEWNTHEHETTYGLYAVWQTSNVRKPYEFHAKALLRTHGAPGSPHTTSAAAHAVACWVRRFGAEAKNLTAQPPRV